MGKLFIIVRSNMRKSKGQTVAIVVLILIASLMLNLWLMLSMDYSANFDRYHDKLNAEHVTFTVDDGDGAAGEFLSEKLAGDKNVKEYRLDGCMHMTGTFSYNNGEMNGWFVFLKKDVALTRSVGKAEIVEEGNIASGVYLPMLYKTNDISVGKPVVINIGSHAVKYTVCGFFNSIMMGSHNCSITEIILTDDMYEQLEASGYAPACTLCSIRLNKPPDNADYRAEFKNALSKRFPDAVVMGNDYDTVVQARYIAQAICSGIMSVMAFLVLLITIVVIVSNIINYIQVNMKNLGALKAIGYTSVQLALSLLMQFLLITFIAAVVGTALAYCIFPAINTMMVSQTGIPYAMPFLPLPVLLTFVILCGVVALFVWLTARKVKKIDPIVALRSGVQTHSFKRNRVPLEKTKAPLDLALALKTTLSNIKHNITVCVTMPVLSLIVVFSGLMIENVISDMTPFLNLVVGETPESCISIKSNFEDEFLSAVTADARVQKVYLYTTLMVTHSGGQELYNIVCDDFSRVNNQSVVYKGRFPKYDNEIALAGKYAKEVGFGIGDEIEISASGKTEKYLICGLTQISNNLGRDCLMTRQGYEKMGEIANLSYYFNIADGADIDEFNSDMNARFAENINTTINGESAIEAMASVYVSLMKIIVVAILALSVVIIAFVLFLLVRTMLANKLRDYGILKALGFTTIQLILQTALSFMPAIMISTLVGLVVSLFAINPLMSLFLSQIGIIKCTFAVPVTFTVFAGLGLVLLSFGIACLLSLKIKKIAPRNLLAGE